VDNSDQARDIRPGEGLDSAGVEAFIFGVPALDKTVRLNIEKSSL